MECLSFSPTFADWLLHYGSFMLFILLVLGIIALPIPDETLLIFAGVLVHDAKLNLLPTVTAAYLGSICGITLSYFLGKTAGHYLLHNYGHYLRLTPERLQRVELWFQKYGKWTLIMGYFVPGVRHFTGLATGMTGVNYKDFALYAYSGAITWASIFLAVGYFFGTYCLSLLNALEIGIDDILVIVVGGIFIYFTIKALKKTKK